MASLSFADRFKNKSSTLTNTALLSINPDFAVCKPLESQVHGSAIGSPTCFHNLQTQYREDSSFRPSIQISRTPNHQITPLGKVFFNQNDDLHQSESRKSPVTPLTRSRISASPSSFNKSLNRSQFKPYTINDYLKLKPNKYYKLGGLGANIGGDDWIKKKDSMEKRKKYVVRAYIGKSVEGEKGKARDMSVKRIRQNASKV